MKSPNDANGTPESSTRPHEGRLRIPYYDGMPTLLISFPLISAINFFTLAASASIPTEERIFVMSSPEGLGFAKAANK